VFAVLIAVLVLDLRPPTVPTFESRLSLWHTWLSYGVSYLFIAIPWANHCRLTRYSTEETSRLLWFNFAHLFSGSLIPLATVWLAVSKLSPQPVAFYTGVFFLVNLMYVFLIWELLGEGSSTNIAKLARHIICIRSISTHCLFAVAAAVALKYSFVGLGVCCCCLVVYLEPDRPGAKV
jgi:uncharacterized membrane protein